MIKVINDSYSTQNSNSRPPRLSKVFDSDFRSDGIGRERGLSNLSFRDFMLSSNKKHKTSILNAIIGHRSSTWV